MFESGDRNKCFKRGYPVWELNTKKERKKERKKEKTKGPVNPYQIQKLVQCTEEMFK